MSYVSSHKQRFWRQHWDPNTASHWPLLLPNWLWRVSDDQERIEPASVLCSSGGFTDSPEFLSMLMHAGHRFPATQATFSKFDSIHWVIVRLVCALSTCRRSWRRISKRKTVNSQKGKSTLGKHINYWSYFILLSYWTDPKLLRAGAVDLLNFGNTLHSFEWNWLQTSLAPWIKRKARGRDSIRKWFLGIGQECG